MVRIKPALIALALALARARCTPRRRSPPQAPTQPYSPPVVSPI